MNALWASFYSRRLLYCPGSLSYQSSKHGCSSTKHLAGGFKFQWFLQEGKKEHYPLEYYLLCFTCYRFEFLSHFSYQAYGLEDPVLHYYRRWMKHSQISLRSLVESRHCHILSDEKYIVHAVAKSCYYFWTENFTCISGKLFLSWCIREYTTFHFPWYPISKLFRENSDSKTFLHMCLSFQGLYYNFCPLFVPHSIPGHNIRRNV